MTKEHRHHSATRGTNTQLNKSRKSAMKRSHKAERAARCNAAELNWDEYGRQSDVIEERTRSLDEEMNTGK